MIALIPAGKPAFEQKYGINVPTTSQLKDVRVFHSRCRSFIETNLICLRKPVILVR